MYHQVRQDDQSSLLPDGEPDWNTSFGENLSAAGGGCEGGGNCLWTISSTLDQGPWVWWIKASGDGLDGVWSRRGSFRRAGDVNNDTALDHGDIDALLGVIYRDETGFSDVDGSGSTDAADLAALLILLNGGS